MEQEELRVKAYRVRDTDRALNSQGQRESVLQWDSDQASQSRGLLRLAPQLAFKAREMHEQRWEMGRTNNCLVSNQ